MRLQQVDQSPQTDGAEGTQNDGVAHRVMRCPTRRKICPAVLTLRSQR